MELETPSKTNLPTPPVKPVEKKSEKKNKSLRLTFDLNNPSDVKILKNINIIRNFLTTGNPVDEPIVKKREFVSSEDAIKLALSKVSPADLAQDFLSYIEMDSQRKTKILTQKYNSRNNTNLSEFDFAMNVWPKIMSDEEQVKDLLISGLQ